MNAEVWTLAMNNRGLRRRRYNGRADLIGELLQSNGRERNADDYASVVRELHEALDTGHRRVPLLALPALPQRVLPLRGARLSRMAGIIIAGAWPFLLNAILFAVAPAIAYHDPHTLLYAGVEVAIAIAMLTLAFACWRFAEGLIPDIADLLTSSPERHSLAAWINRRTRVLPQVVTALIGFVSCMLLITAVVRSPHHGVDAGPSLYAMVGWLGALGGCTIYWLYVVAGIPRQLYRCSGLRLAWFDPAHTPAIVKLCRMYGLVAAGMFFGVIATEFAAIIVVGEHASAALRLIVFGFPVFAAVTALYVGAQPYLFLYLIVRERIDLTVSPLLTRHGSPPPGLLALDDFEQGAIAYTHFRGLRRLPVRMGVVVQYMTGILGSLIVYFLQQLLS